MEEAIVEVSVPRTKARWEYVQLRSIAQVVYGKAHPQTPGIIPVVGSGGIFGRTAEPLTTGDTLVIGRKGAAGAVFYITEPCYPSDTTFYLRFTQEVCIPYIYYELTYHGLVPDKSVIPSLSRWDVENYIILLPPLPEQRAIARILRTVQDTIQARRRELELERERKAALMQHLFSKGTRGEPTKLTEIGEMPVSWQPEHLGELIADGPKNGLYKHNSLYGSGTPIVRINDFDNDGDIVTVASNRIWLSEQEVREFGLQTNDLLVNRVNSLTHLGKVALIGQLEEPTVYESNMMRFRVDSMKVLPELVFRFLNSPPCRTRVKAVAKRAVAQSSINQEDVKSLLVPVPAITEQHDLVTVFNAADVQAAALGQEAIVLDELFHSILEELMTGRLSALPLVEAEAEVLA